MKKIVFLNKYDELDSEIEAKHSEAAEESSENIYKLIETESLNSSRSAHSKSNNPFQIQDSKNLEENFVSLGSTDFDKFVENVSLKKNIRKPSVPRQASFLNSKHFAMKRKPRVFGQNFKQFKNYVINSTHLLNLKQEERNDLTTKLNLAKNNVGGAIDSMFQQSSNAALKNIFKEMTNELIDDNEQRDSRSEKLKMLELQNIFKVAMHQRNEFQKEVFEMYKTISTLEINKRANDCKQNELVYELKIANQKVSDAEKHTAVAISRVQELESRLEKAERKITKYGTKLSHSRDEVATLQGKIQELQKMNNEESDMKLQLLSKVNQAENSERSRREELLAMCEKNVENEKIIIELQTRLTTLSDDNSNYQSQIFKLETINDKLKEENQSLNLSYEEARNSLDYFKNLTEVQREKSKLMIGSTIALEAEVQEMHVELSKHKIEKEKLSVEINNLLKSLSQCRNLMKSYKEYGEKMKIEKRFAEEKILYFDNFKKVIENKKNLYNKENSELNNEKNKTEQQISIENSKSDVAQKEFFKEDNDTLSNVSFISNASHEKSALTEMKDFTFKGDYTFSPFLKKDVKKNQVSSFSDLMKDNGIANALL
ncbi:myosin-2 heavy chain, non muscle [Hydra vulgaris]|uniref:myosin-2 heavy chain, non muscle n=1 Tax=Hydra vulgaris TaxID=6087 RepID=UPI000640C607|nr:myosin-2 heavy chain, non muscle [Hydra vulgaris]